MQTNMMAGWNLYFVLNVMVEFCVELGDKRKVTYGHLDASRKETLCYEHTLQKFRTEIFR
jgi:hypothetical protein